MRRRRAQPVSFPDLKVVKVQHALLIPRENVRVTFNLEAWAELPAKHTDYGVGIGHGE